MKIKAILLSVFILALTWSQCQAADRVLVSVIYSSDIEPYLQSCTGFKEFFKDKKIALWFTEYFLLDKNTQKIVAQVNAEKPDIVFAIGTRAAKLAEESFKDKPIVYAMVLNPEKLTGANLAGVLLDVPVRMQLEALQKVFPEAKKIGVVYTADSTNKVTELNQTCGELGLKLVKRKVNDEKELPAALADITWQINCLLMIPDAKIYFPQSVKYLLLESLRQKFPVIGLSKYHSKSGALLSIDCDYEDLGRQAGEIALRVLNGERPVDIKPVKPRKTSFSLNLSTAARLDIKFSPEIVENTNNVFGENK
ncbi:MAG: ABC transporter substrate-binding protein [bacterium]|jgi:putative ABC transport system substrate-binding protein|nr:ABC transporter substrate-binding protein [bacterium]